MNSCIPLLLSTMEKTASQTTMQNRFKQLPHSSHVYVRKPSTFSIIHHCLPVSLNSSPNFLFSSSTTSILHCPCSFLLLSYAYHLRTYSVPSQLHSPPTLPFPSSPPLTSASHRVQHSQLPESVLKVLSPPWAADGHKRLNNQVASLEWSGRHQHMSTIHCTQCTYSTCVHTYACTYNSTYCTCTHKVTDITIIIYEFSMK